jgi:hypothetical protein
MSNVIDFLERMGRDASLHSCTRQELEQEMKRAGIDPAVIAALQSGNYRALEDLLGANAHVCCLIRTPDDEEDDEDDTEDDGEQLNRIAVVG